MPANELDMKEMSLAARLNVIDDGIRKKYLACLSDMQIAPIDRLASLEDDLISNVRLYHITEMVYQKGESVTDEQMDEINEEDLSTEEYAYYIDVMARIQKKLLEIPG